MPIRTASPTAQIWLDPGLGFGKTAQHNLEILRRLPELKALGYPLVVGASRKKFLGKIFGTDDPQDRMEGTAAAVALSIAGGADMVRVHDVREMARVAKVSDAIVRGWEEPPPRLRHPYPHRNGRGATHCQAVRLDKSHSPLSLAPLPFRRGRGAEGGVGAYFTFAPGARSASPSGVSRTAPPSASVAASSMPWLWTPRMVAGCKLATMTILRPGRLSGE